MSGYIKLHKQIQDNFLWCDKPFSKGQAWVDLLLLANFKDGEIMAKGVVVEVKRGQVFRTVKWLSDRWGWSRKKTNFFLSTLENQKMATLEGTPQGTLITIENYAFFNDVGTTEETTEGETKVQPRYNQGTQKKKNKKNKNIYIDIYKDVPEAIRPAFMEWAEMRKQIKKPITTQSTVTRALNRLNQLSPNPQKQIELIEYATDKNWRSFYPIPKDEQRRPQREYKEEEVIDAVPMPDEVRDNIDAFIRGLE